MSAPSAWQIEQAMACLQSLRRDEALSSDETDLLAAIEAGEQDVFVLLRRVILAATEAGSYADAVKARQDDLTARKARYDARAQAYRRTAFSVMDALSITKFEQPEFTASIGSPRAGISITDEAALPEEYVRVMRAPDKAKIADALKNGVVITGAASANGMPTLNVRVK